MCGNQNQKVISIIESGAGKKDQSAFVLRISSGDPARIKEALTDNQISIGWTTPGLLDPTLTWEQAREKIKQDCYPEDKNARRAGAATGQLWGLFINRMKPGDLVVVPCKYSGTFYVAEITGDRAIYKEDKVGVCEAYRRDVVWLNKGKPIPRTMARSALISRMKTYSTCVDASDLLKSIQECVALAEKGKNPTFQTGLKERLIKETLDELQNGRMDPRRFEQLICTVLHNLGANHVDNVSTRLDKGADIVATFDVAGFIPQKVAVQAKHWQSKPPVGKDVVEQLIHGIEAEGAHLGMVITTGLIGEEAEEEATRYQSDTGIMIELVDGEEFARLIVENGIRETA